MLMAKFVSETRHCMEGAFYNEVFLHVLCTLRV